MTRSRIIAAGKIAVTFIALLALFAIVDFRSVANVSRQINISTITAAVILISLQNLLAAVRWRLVLRSVQISLPFRQVFRMFYISSFFNQIWPSSIGGDVLRAWLARRAGSEVESVLASVILDRITALLGLVALIFSVQLIMIFKGENNELTNQLNAVAFFIVVAIVVFAGIAHRMPVFGTNRIRRGLRRMLELINQYFRKPLQSIAPATSSYFGFVMMCGVVALFLQNIGSDVTFWQIVVLCPPVFLVASIPITVGGWGVREGTMVFALGYAGVAPGEALAASIFLGLVVLAAALPGLFLLWSAGIGGEQQPQVDV